MILVSCHNSSHASSSMLSTFSLITTVKPRQVIVLLLYHTCVLIKQREPRRLKRLIAILPTSHTHITLVQLVSRLHCRNLFRAAAQFLGDGDVDVNIDIAVRAAAFRLVQGRLYLLGPQCMY